MIKMQLMDIVQEICDKQIPREVNGVRTQFEIETEKDSSYGEIALKIKISPCSKGLYNLSCAFLSRLPYDLLDDDKEKTKFISSRLENQIGEALLMYIRNIIKNFEGKVIKEVSKEEVFNDLANAPRRKSGELYLDELSKEV